MMKLDHFVGRAVESVTDGDERGQWKISLDGDATIWNLDPSIEKPMGLEGTIFCRATDDTPIQLAFSQGSEPDGSAKIVKEISLNPDKYAVGMQEPQKDVAPASDHLPPDPSAERVVDGPEPLPTPVEAEDG